MPDRTETDPDRLETDDASQRGNDRLPPEPGTDATQDDIVADIEETREQLRQTVDSISAKLDVKANAKARLEQARTTATAKVGELQQNATAAYTRAQQSDAMTRARANPAILAGTAAALVAVVVGVVVWQRRR